MPDNTHIEEVLLSILDSLHQNGYSKETISNYKVKFNTLYQLAQNQGITDITDDLLHMYLNDTRNKYTGEYSVYKERVRVRVVNLIRSFIRTGEIDTSRRKGNSVGDRIQTDSFKNELNSFVSRLQEDGLCANTICTYKRIVAYLFLYCEENSLFSIATLTSDHIKNFILYLYSHGYFKPTTITSALSGLKKFLLQYPETKNLISVLPSRLPRERKIVEIYNQHEVDSINDAISDPGITKRDKAICLLLLETGLRGVDICNIRLCDIDWKKDLIYIVQQKTGTPIYLPLRESYGNAIVDYILHERPECKSPYLFVREIAPYTRLDGEGSSVRVIVAKVESMAGISDDNRITGSRLTRHTAASSMLRSGVPMPDISAVLGHTDPNVVTVYLSTDEIVLSTCTLPVPGGDNK